MNNRLYLDYQHFEDIAETMPVPTWDCSPLGMLEDQPHNTTTTVVSEDIWKKFDLDFPQSSFSTDRYYGDSVEDGIMYDPNQRGSYYGGYEKSGSSFFFSSSSGVDAREIRHHDCMWAGLCISKEHNKNHPVKKKGSHLQKKTVQAGRSLLISRKQQQPSGTGSACNATVSSASPLMRNLESDGDSTRPETPQSCESDNEEEEDEDDDEESEDEVLRFKHDSISLNEKLSEYLGTGIPTAAPVSEVTGQLMSRKINAFRVNQPIQDIPKVKYIRKNENTKKGRNGNAQCYGNGNRNGHGNGVNNRQVIERGNTGYQQNTNCMNIVPLSDHCYHINQTSTSKKLEHLGVQTPSDSEEEIDVVTFEKPSCAARPASLPTNPSIADKQHFQKTVTSALKEKPPPRPRGRPPSNIQRKRAAQTDQKPAKKAKQKINPTSSQQKRGGRGCSSSAGSSNKIGNGSGANKNVDKIRENVVVSGKNRIENNCNNSCIIENCGDVHCVDNGRNIIDNRGSKGGNVATNYGTSRSTSSDEEPDIEKRSLHNNMERQRRIELRNAFEELRLLVPEVEMKEKAPKVVILREAVKYCNSLTEFENRLALVTELSRRQRKLRIRLSQLRRNFRLERRGIKVSNYPHSSSSSTDLQKRRKS